MSDVLTLTIEVTVRPALDEQQPATPAAVVASLMEHLRTIGEPGPITLPLGRQRTTLFSVDGDDGPVYELLTVVAPAVSTDEQLPPMCDVPMPSYSSPDPSPCLGCDHFVVLDRTTGRWAHMDAVSTRTTNQPTERGTA